MSPTQPSQRPYTKPVLVRIGSFRELTRVKASNKADGTGKPATRASGGNA